uniref:Uncharacterized protein n=1 Tax=Romanomermis culicivorax TaxID=13658 RepID=A0A915IFV3_ROMCU
MKDSPSTYTKPAATMMIDEHPLSKLLWSIKAATSKALETTRQLAASANNLPICDQLSIMDSNDKYHEVFFGDELLKKSNIFMLNYQTGATWLPKDCINELEATVRRVVVDQNQIANDSDFEPLWLQVVHLLQKRCYNLWQNAAKTATTHQLVQMAIDTD